MARPRACEICVEEYRSRNFASDVVTLNRNSRELGLLMLGSGVETGVRIIGYASHILEKGSLH